MRPLRSLLLGLALAVLALPAMAADRTYTSDAEVRQKGLNALVAKMSETRGSVPSQEGIRGRRQVPRSIVPQQPISFASPLGARGKAVVKASDTSGEHREQSWRS